MRCRMPRTVHEARFTHDSSRRQQMKEIRFFIPGTPSPGGSKSAFCLKKGGRYTGRAVVVDAGGKKTKLWRQEVAKAARLAMDGETRLTEAVEIELIFHMPRPKSHYRSDGLMLRSGRPPEHITRPDCTKLARSTEDAMTGIVYADDGQIVKQTHEKFYCEPEAGGAWIIIREAGK